MPWASRLYHERRGESEPLLLVTGFAISSAVFEPVLDLYAAPTLVIHGERDQLVPIRNAHTLMQRMRDLLLNWMSRTREEPHVAAHR
jgi:predicted esterase